MPRHLRTLTRHGTSERQLSTYFFETEQRATEASEAAAGVAKDCHTGAQRLAEEFVRAHVVAGAAANDEAAKAMAPASA